MSTPAGQSLAQALQDRHRSSDSCTSASGPVGDQRAVGEFLQHPRPPAGDVLLVPGGQVGRAHETAGRGGVGAALADADAAVHGLGEIPVVVGEARTRRPPARRGRTAGAGRHRAGSGRTSTPGLSRSAGSKIALTAANNSIAAREYMIGSSSLRARPSPCSPEQEPPCATTSAAASSMKSRKTGAAGPLQREVDAGCARSRHRNARTGSRSTP